MHNTEKPANYELWGLRLEIVGLAALLAAAIWQIHFNDSLERHLIDDAIAEQRATNRLLFEAMRDLGGLIGEREKIDLQEDVKVMQAKITIAGKITGTMTESREITKSVLPYFSRIRFYMATLGALLIIVGKYLVFRHKREQAENQMEG